MIDLQKEIFMEKRVGDFLVPSERVAHVQIGNNLEHALLVLTKSGYTAIPVLDPKYKLHGLISSPLILDSILGIERIEFEKLDSIPVEQVMKKDIPILNVDDSLNKGLKLLINHPFVCAVDQDGYFEGILTRRIVLKQLNALLHQLHIQLRS
ncbi:cyclic-di-AMP-binding protein CbpB [Fervidibacillus albus]|uniref:CBS domain-containing protein n=1 Tax=Fervidibacillus albus TaxID=2980026 RepID=A0A9E8RYX4_9BACI|nr:cyclic-di-AMP-binding protein CbpB [Fervidibacillus albus]WAA11117.1 CBS domain-containing protein [Fervidibacillus albus]